MLISEVRVVNVSVDDLDAALALYSGVLGLDLIARGGLPEELAAPWRIPAGMRGETALLAAGSERTGMVRLVDFDAPEHDRPRIWTKENQMTGNGFWAINFRVRDVGVLLPKLLQAGVTGRDRPKLWSISEDVAVWDSITTDPDGVHLDLFSYERGGERRGQLVGEISPLQTIAMCVHDMEKTRAFYEGIGFRVLWERELHGLWDLLDLPEGVALYDVNLVRDPAVMPGRVELFQFLDAGDGSPPAADPLTGLAVPPARGVLSVSMETPDLDLASRLLLDLGAAPVAGPVEADIPGIGPASTAAFLGPEGECLELYEPG